MATGYATNTTVSVEKSKMEIDALLAKHGASSRGIVVDDEKGTALIGFVRGGLQYRLAVPLPLPETAKKLARPRAWPRWDEHQRAAWLRKEWEQMCRTRWRAMLLLLKAKFEAINMQVSTIEKEFMADLVLPNGETVAVALGKTISEALGSGKMPTLMLPANASA